MDALADRVAAAAIGQMSTSRAVRRDRKGSVAAR